MNGEDLKKCHMYYASSKNVSTINLTYLHNYYYVSNEVYSIAYLIFCEQWTIT